MEIEDSSYPLVLNVETSTNPDVAFTEADVVVVLGGFPRAPGMERKDLIGINANGMKLQAESLNKFAKRTCKVLVVANPCNTNCLVMSKIATNIPKENFSGLTRLDQERLNAYVVREVNNRLSTSISFNDVRNAIIWGNHSSTQVPDVNNIEIFLNNEWVRINTVLDSHWLESDLIRKVQTRGAEIIKAQGASSGMSAANAIAKHLRDWLQCNPTANEVFSIAIHSDNNPYNIPSNLVYSFPCKYNSNNILEIVPNFIWNENIQALIDKTTKELIDERSDAEEIVGSLHE